MAEERTYMPSGGGGLLRFQEEEDQVIKIKPEYLVYIVAAIVAFELAGRFVVPV